MGVEEIEEKKWYIRFPVRIPDEFFVKNFHPNITEVRLPRQKSRRWCIVAFGEAESIKETIKALKKVRIENKSLKISPLKSKSKPEIKSRRTKLGAATAPLLKLIKQA